MNGKQAWLGLLGAALLLGACADPPDPAARRLTSTRISPPPIPAATVPAGTFDHARAQAALAGARAAQGSGDLATARSGAETALAAWPIDGEAWGLLGQLCQSQNDTACQRYAALFGDKIAFTQTIPARAAMLGYQSMRTGNANGSQGPDTRTLAMAERLEAFYHLVDGEAGWREAPKPEPFLERNPWAPYTAGAAAGAALGIAWNSAR